ncbi:ketopantoate reductase family protein [Hydrogenobacter hydrogenophilus]|uniref:2-dehydropantoate 2-reductase n=1 Tax=Hydrogenobacter hydrogenophilus TaxID=35835 RepID=A0A285NNA5_9AQUI|nr:2-dehydropantoate 2-reductase [Hydrogenobacter hydrogenophilus]SNZ11014.1 ketopantoate reductase [Hydrogenobacter hydrogenophilus]
MKFLVVGVGAVGSVFLSFLSRAGYKAVGLVKPGRSLSKIKVEGIWGEFEQEVITVEDLSLVEYTPDVIVLSVKSYDTQSALEGLSSFVEKGSYILIAQNGYGNYEKAVELFGDDKVILSRIIFGAKRTNVDRVRITVCADPVVIGSPSGNIKEEFLNTLADIFSKAGIPTRHDREVYKYLWEKIIYNCALNPLGALFELTYGQLVENPYTREIINGIIDEIFMVLKAHRIETFHTSSEEYKRHFYEKLVPPTANHYPSMLEDIKKGKTEIDALNGAIVELGKQANIETPINSVITNMVKGVCYDKAFGGSGRCFG